MENRIQVVGVDFRTAPLAVRSRFAFSDTQKIEFSSRLSELGFQESAVLSTCNRSEVYFVAKEDRTGEAQREMLRYFNAADCDAAVYSFCGLTAVKHLFRVSAGLESAVIGEDQVLGQVSDAIWFATVSGSAKKLLNRAFRDAVTVGKQVKSELGISDIPLSVVYIGIKKLNQAMNGLAGKSFLVIGSGEMGRLAVKYLEDERAGSVYLCSRSCGKGESAQPDGQQFEPVPFAERYDYITEIDGIVSATASPHAVLKGEKMPERTKPLCIIDLAVPPDVDESVYHLPYTSVINVDELNTSSAENLERRLGLAEQAEALIDIKAEELENWLFHNKVDTAIESMNRRCREIANDTEQFLFYKLELSEREKKLVAKMIESSLRRLVREPILRLKKLDNEGKQEEYIAVVKELFDFEETEE
ncbi:MAG: glutamyl-tRNA reductase [Oscillospiraceae bacterium]